MKTFFVFSILTMFFYKSFSQQTSSIKALSLELGKTGIIFNLNYDQKFSRLGFRVGAGSNFNKYLKAITFGGGGYYLIGKEKNFFEIGTEVNYLSVENFYSGLIL